MRLIGILTCFIFSYAHAQNLIPNSSFEDENVCELAIPCSPAAWYSVSNMPYGYENKFEHQVKGKRAISFLIAISQGARTYWQVPLLSGIKKGNRYTLHFYLYSPIKKFNREYFGIYFSNSVFRSRKDTILHTPSSIKINDSTIHQFKDGWLEISFDFEAPGDAKYMLMGNFSAISNLDILKAYSKKSDFIEYFIDDISLMAKQKQNQDEPDLLSKRLDSLYKTNFRHRSMTETVSAKGDMAETAIFPLIKTDTLLLGRINFRFDSYELLNQQMIRNYFNAINIKTITRITITGYTDSVGNNAYNLVLSENRAISVKKFLADSLQILSNKISTEGRGKTNDQKLQEENRRVELVIYRKE